MTAVQGPKLQAHRGVRASELEIPVEAPGTHSLHRWGGTKAQRARDTCPGSMHDSG